MCSSDLFFLSFFLSFFLPFILSHVDDSLGALAVDQACACEEGAPSSEYGSTRDLPAPRNIKWRKFPRDVHLKSKTQLHSMTSKLQCWTPYAKQDRNTTPPISREAAENHSKITDIPKHTTGCGAAHKKDKIQPHLPEHRHQSPLPPTETPLANGGRHQKQREL